MKQFTQQVDNLSERIMIEKDENKLNMYLNALHDIMSNTSRYTQWIINNI